MKQLIIPLTIVIGASLLVIALIFTIMPGPREKTSVPQVDRVVELSRQLGQELQAKQALQNELSQLRWSKEQLQKKLDELQEENCKLREAIEQLGGTVPEPTSQTPPERMHAMDEMNP